MELTALQKSKNQELKLNHKSKSITESLNRNGTYLLPSLTNAIAMTILFRRTNTTNRMMTSKIAKTIPPYNQVFGFSKYELASKLKFVFIETSPGGCLRKYK